MKKNNTTEEMTLLDRGKKIYTKIKLTADRKFWEVFVSSTKRNWRKTETGLTLDEVMKKKGEVIDSNYKNLFNIITEKK